MTPERVNALALHSSSNDSPGWGPSPLDVSLWQDRLEVCVDDVMELARRDDYVDGWVDDLGPRFRPMVVARLGLSATTDKARIARALRESIETLAELLLVEEATSRKRSHVLADVARSALSAKEIARCTKPNGELDRRALGWSLYQRAPENLELVFHLDRMHRKGLVRLSMKGPRPAVTASTDAFFRKETLQDVLNEYEHGSGSLRESHCAAVLHVGGCNIVFVKRDHRRAFLSRGPENQFGFLREWIILAFDRDLGHVRVASTSTDPVGIANAVASKFYGRAISYGEVVVMTRIEHIDAFIQSAMTPAPKVPIVELTLSDSPLPNGPSVSLSVPSSRDLGAALAHLSAMTDAPFASARRVEGLRVLWRSRRIRIRLEHVSAHDVVVRYEDRLLDVDQREAFEREMGVHFGLHLGSIEVRHAA